MGKTKGSRNRRYTDDERANAVAAVAANGGNVNGTAKKLGIPQKTLEQWVRGDFHPEAVKNSEGKKADLADQFESLAYKLVGIADRKAESLNAKDAVIAAGVAVDKMRLLRGQATTITEIDLTLIPDGELDNLDRTFSLAAGTVPLPALVSPPGEGAQVKTA